MADQQNTNVPTKNSRCRNNKLGGKVAIITGGASGIGEATARLFAALGARAVVIADIQDGKGRTVAASIGETCTYVRCDVSDEAQVEALVASTVASFGRLDVMFSNAGVPSASGQEVLDLDLAAMDRLFAVNARGMAACVKHAARAMRAQCVRGSIVCTASVLASVGSEKFTDYVMSKHAVLGLVRSASLQLGGEGIRVNAVSPGPAETPLMRDLLRILGVDTEEAVRAFAEGSRALKVGVGAMTPDQVAEAVAFLASGESEYITGHNLVIDGGYIHLPL